MDTINTLFRLVYTQDLVLGEGTVDIIDNGGNTVSAFKINGSLLPVTDATGVDIFELASGSSIEDCLLKLADMINDLPDVTITTLPDDKVIGTSVTTDALGISPNSTQSYINRFLFNRTSGVVGDVVSGTSLTSILDVGTAQTSYQVGTLTKMVLYDTVSRVANRTTDGSDLVFDFTTDTFKNTGDVDLDININFFANMSMVIGSNEYPSTMSRSFMNIELYNINSDSSEELVAISLNDRLVRQGESTVLENQTSQSHNINSIYTLKVGASLEFRFNILATGVTGSTSVTVNLDSLGISLLSVASNGKAGVDGADSTVPGPAGADGADSLIKYNFTESIETLDAGQLGYSLSGNVVSIYAHKYNANTQLISMIDAVEIDAYVYVYTFADSTNNAQIKVTNITDDGDYWIITGTFTSNYGTFSENDVVVLDFKNDVACTDATHTVDYNSNIVAGEQVILCGFKVSAADLRAKYQDDNDSKNVYFNIDILVNNNYSGQVGLGNSIVSIGLYMSIQTNGYITFSAWQGGCTGTGAFSSSPFVLNNSNRIIALTDDDFEFEIAMDDYYLSVGNQDNTFVNVNYQVVINSDSDIIESIYGDGSLSTLHNIESTIIPVSSRGLIWNSVQSKYTTGYERLEVADAIDDEDAVNKGQMILAIADIPTPDVTTPNVTSQAAESWNGVDEPLATWQANAKVLIDNNIAAISAQASASMEYVYNGDLPLTTVEQQIPIVTLTPSSNTDVMDIDDTNNQAELYVDARYTYYTVISVTNDTQQDHIMHLITRTDGGVLLTDREFTVDKDGYLLLALELKVADITGTPLIFELYARADDSNALKITYLKSHISASGEALVSSYLKKDGSNADDVVTLKALTLGGKIIEVVAEYTDNAAAITAGLTVGAHYRTGDLLKIVH